MTLQITAQSMYYVLHFLRPFRPDISESSSQIPPPPLPQLVSLAVESHVHPDRVEAASQTAEKLRHALLETLESRVGECSRLENLEVVSCAVPITEHPAFTHVVPVVRMHECTRDAGEWSFD